MIKLQRDFFTRDVLEVAPDLLGKYIVVVNNGTEIPYQITEVEAYKGTEDLACHASKGRTKRTEVMYQQGGKIYVYLIYGMHWLLNIVTGEAENPQAVLIRGIKQFTGPGRVSRQLGIDGSFYAEDLIESQRIWIADDQIKPTYFKRTRIGVDYAGDYWKNMPWRFIIQP
jgi:DNA-3-methyladenine glycosylase